MGFYLSIILASTPAQVAEAQVSTGKNKVSLNTISQVFENIDPHTLGWALVISLFLCGWALLLWHPKFRDLGQLNLKGLLLLQRSPLWTGDLSEKGAEEDFRNQLLHIQAKYAPIQIQFDLHPDSLRVEFETPHPLWVNRPGVPERLQEQIQILLDCLPPDKYFIQTHLKGSISGLNRIQNFALVNQDRRIGLQKTETARVQLKGIFFNG